LASHLQQQGYQKAHVFIDNNPTHQQKMLTLFQEQSASLSIQLLFHYLPKYSPKLNLVEYLIHLIRQKWLGQPRFITAITIVIWPPSKPN